MDDVTLGLSLIGSMVALIVLGLPIGITLISTGAIGVWLIGENSDLAFRFTALATYLGIQGYLFATIPLFVLMGLLVSISDLGKHTFDVAQNMPRRVKGGLGTATVGVNTVGVNTVGVNAVFAAVTDVSIASAAVFTKVAVPEMVRHGYTMRFATGTVAGSSILGMLIPPSLLMIVYGVLAGVSIGVRFVAGVIPGVIIAIGFAVMIWWYATFAPHRIMDHLDSPATRDQPLMSVGEMLGKSVPILSLAALILGEPLLGEPGTGVTQTFITIGCFDDEAIAEACLKYVRSKFARALLGVLKITQHNPAKAWKYVPIQDFTEASDIDWSKPIPAIDQQLYVKYGLTPAEIAFIEARVKPMG